MIVYAFVGGVCFAALKSSFTALRATPLQAFKHTLKIAASLWRCLRCNTELQTVLPTLSLGRKNTDSQALRVPLSLTWGSAVTDTRASLVRGAAFSVLFLRPSVSRGGWSPAV